MPVPKLVKNGFLFLGFWDLRAVFWAAVFSGLFAVAALLEPAEMP